MSFFFFFLGSVGDLRGIWQLVDFPIPLTVVRFASHPDFSHSFVSMRFGYPSPSTFKLISLYRLVSGFSSRASSLCISSRICGNESKVIQLKMYESIFSLTKSSSSLFPVLETSDCWLLLFQQSHCCRRHHCSYGFHTTSFFFFLWIILGNSELLFDLVLNWKIIENVMILYGIESVAHTLSIPKSFASKSH